MATSPQDYKNALFAVEQAISELKDLSQTTFQNNLPEINATFTGLQAAMSVTIRIIQKISLSMAAVSDGQVVNDASTSLEGRERPTRSQIRRELRSGKRPTEPDVESGREKRQMTDLDRMHKPTGAVSNTSTTNGISQFSRFGDATTIIPGLSFISGKALNEIVDGRSDGGRLVSQSDQMNELKEEVSDGLMINTADRPSKSAPAANMEARNIKGLGNASDPIVIEEDVDEIQVQGQEILENIQPTGGFKSTKDIENFKRLLSRFGTELGNDMNDNHKKRHFSNKLHELETTVAEETRRVYKGMWSSGDLEGDLRDYYDIMKSLILIWQWETRIRGRRENLLQLEKPLVDVGGHIRCRFLQIASEKQKYGRQQQGNRSFGSQGIVDAGNNAAHRGNVEADYAMFKLGCLVGEEWVTIFRSLYNVTVERYEDTFKTVKVDEMMNLEATMVSYSSFTQWSLSPELVERFRTLHLECWNMLQTKARSIGHCPELRRWFDGSAEVETNFRKMRALVECMNRLERKQARGLGGYL